MFRQQAHSRSLYVGFVAFNIALWSFIGALRSEEVKEPSGLPAPVMNPDSPEEDRAFRSLTKPTQVDFIDVPLSNALQFLSDFHNLPIRIDEAALTAAKIPIDSPVTLTVINVPFQRVLISLLMPLGLDWYVESPGLIVTTESSG